ncbi:MAG: UDP-N-acetylmuramoyl-L-alanyl-D-glutamate--2,6-diaminopimelate ligase [Anaerolineaceae bacterium 46_22]|nr:MAG: UDP-N-acetylmuramoyl-L-alanyl-D-glutamate--2,6-diaminopimelate ligase [Anaerolineaceae bacterium 46_22]
MTEKRMKHLKACLVEMTDWVRNTFEDTLISGIAWDSRKVRPGDLFFALVGENFDGHQFITSAVKQGAAAVVGTRPPMPLEVPYVQLQGDDRLAVAKVAAAFYDHPSRDLVVIGVTGCYNARSTGHPALPGTHAGRRVDPCCPGDHVPWIDTKACGRGGL